MALSKPPILDRISASAGTIVVNDTNEYSARSFHSIFFPEDTVVARIEINGATATDVKANYITTAATAVKANTLMTSQGDDYFSAITLTSGSAVLILNQA
jgi:hypothetical protein